MYATMASGCIIGCRLCDCVQGSTPNWEEFKKTFPDIYFHSGRTDANGGHRDWINRTGFGFGSYHYHHKLPAHLHPNGKCPYESKNADSITNPYTGKGINIGIPYIFEGNRYCSLNSVIKALTANDEQDIVHTTNNAGGLFYVCSAGDSTIENPGTIITFYYPDFHEFLDNMAFKTLNGDIQLLAASDGDSTEAYISLETVRDYMTKDGYFTDFSDGGSGVWSFNVRKPIVEAIIIIKQGEPVDSNVFNVGDEIEVQAYIKYVASAKMVVGKQYPTGYIDGFEERRYGLENQSIVTFSKFKLTEDVIGNAATESGSLDVSISGHTGGTAIDAEIDARTLENTITIRVGNSGETTESNINYADPQTQKEFIWEYILNNFSISKMHVAAILGNIQQESNFSPTNAQDSYGYPGNINPEYIENYQIDDGVGWGLVQWTYYIRKQGLLDFATNLGTSIGDMVTQLEYLHHELHNVSPYNLRFKTFLLITNIDDATQYFCEQIEQAGTPHMSQRQKYARDIYNEFT